jgi:hypothetical protein
MKPTREQILAEPAGPQMDAWVAEYVMGWVRRKGSWCELYSRGRGWITGFRSSEIVGHWIAFAPSTTWAAAGEVLDHAAPDLFCLVRTIHDDGGQLECYSAEMRELLATKQDEVPVTAWCAHGDTGPHAISRASLLTVLEDEA